MNTKNPLLYLGLGTFAVALAAYASSAARSQSPYAAPQPPQKIQKQVQVIDDEPFSDDENLEVFVGNGSWLGVETGEVTKEHMKEWKLPAERGAAVSRVIPDSPAAKAGLREKDVISEVNGQRVEGAVQFRRMIREIPAGREAELTVWRDGRSQNIHVTLGKSEVANRLGKLPRVARGGFAFQVPEIPEFPADMSELQIFGAPGFAQPKLGIDAEDISGAFGSYFGAPDGQGVLVRGVFDNSPAAKAGLSSGDVITSVDGQRIRNVAELRERMHAKKEDKTMKLGVIRDKSQISVDVQLPKAEKQEIHQGLRTNI